MFAETKYSRLLIYDGSIDNIIGTVHQKDFYVGTGITPKPLRDILSPVIFVLESEPISRLLKKLQKAKTHLAVVLDEYGGTCGIVTMEDILEELVGEILDEHDEEEILCRETAPGVSLVSASMDFEDFREAFGLQEESEMVSLSGWVMEHFGHVPQPGEQFDCEHLRIRVTKVEGHRVDEIEVRQLAPAGDAAETPAS